MSDHRLLPPALLQDGTLISIHTFKWPTVFIKDRFFSEPGLLLKKKKKIEARRFRTINHKASKSFVYLTDQDCGLFRDYQNTRSFLQYLSYLLDVSPYVSSFLQSR